MYSTQILYPQARLRTSGESDCENRPSVPCIIDLQSNMSFEKHIIIILYAKTNLTFGNSSEPNINNSSTVSEWTAVCESCIFASFQVR